MRTCKLSQAEFLFVRKLLLPDSRTQPRIHKYICCNLQVMFFSKHCTQHYSQYMISCGPHMNLVLTRNVLLVYFQSNREMTVGVSVIRVIAVIISDMSLNNHYFFIKSTIWLMRIISTQSKKNICTILMKV